MKPQSIKWSSVAGLLVCIVFVVTGFLMYFNGKRDAADMWGAVFFGFCALYYSYDLFRPKSTAPAGNEGHGGEVWVTFTDTTISAKYGNGETRSVPWASLTKVGIVTTDEGPIVQDVFWGLHTEEEVAIAYPQDAHGSQELLSAMQAKLVGFDNEKVVVAMGSTSNAGFKIWERVSSPPM